MIELFEQSYRRFDRQSSKGNQLKWENEGIWYKADYSGYEGLSEYISSNLLKHSTLNEEEYVLYELEQIKYKTTTYNGVRCNDFLVKDWQIITLERLYMNFVGESLYKQVWRISGSEDRLAFLVNQVERITGLKEFGRYMNILFTIDAFFLNEDRHLHNIAVLMNSKGEYDYCPIFDQGAALLSDTKMDYPLGEDVYSLIDSVKAKTICEDFDEQLDVSEKLYGENIKFCFDKGEVDRLLDSTMIYSDEINERVRLIIYDRMRKYGYLLATSVI